MTLPVKALYKVLARAASDPIMLHHSPKNKYPPTCGITEEIEKIFCRNESRKEQQRIKDDLGRMNLFVVSVRERIEEYVAWQQKINVMLEEQKRLSPGLSALVAELEKDLSQIAGRYAHTKDTIKTPDCCAGLSNQIIALTAAKLTDEEKEEQCKQLGRQIRTIGGAQDTLLGVYRAVVKATRQYATVKLMTASDAKAKTMLETIRTETGLILNNVHTMEGKDTY